MVPCLRVYTCWEHFATSRQHEMLAQRRAWLCMNCPMGVALRAWCRMSTLLNLDEVAAVSEVEKASESRYRLVNLGTEFSRDSPRDENSLGSISVT